MFSNETISIVESEHSGLDVHEVGTWGGIGIFLILGAIALLGSVIRGVFIYYIKYEAPGDRPINSMIMCDQVRAYLHFLNTSLLVKLKFWRILQGAQLVTMSAISAMTTLPILTQKPMFEYVGQAGCRMYWGVNILYQWFMATAGFGMATYRLICFHYLFKKELNTKKIAKYILLTELVVSVGMTCLSAWSYARFGWEKAFFYQFCMNMGPNEVITIHEYTHKGYVDLNGDTPIWIVRRIVGML